MPWLRPEQGPVLRQWAELEELRTCCFAGLVQYGALRVEANEISAKRLVHDLRQIVQVQIVLERELLMTPAARAQMKAVGSGESLDDLLALAADAPEPEKPAKPDEPDESENDSE